MSKMFSVVTLASDSGLLEEYYAPGSPDCAEDLLEDEIIRDDLRSLPKSDRVYAEVGTYLMASHPALAEKVERYFSPDGIDFGGLMKKEEFDYDWMKLTADAARNLFSWNSKCAATPFEISRMPAPAIQALYTSFFIANGDYAVSVRENEDGKKEFVMDDSAGREREKIRQQFDRMLADIGAEMG